MRLLTRIAIVWPVLSSPVSPVPLVSSPVMLSPKATTGKVTHSTPARPAITLDIAGKILPGGLLGDGHILIALKQALDDVGGVEGEALTGEVQPIRLVYVRSGLDP